MAQELTASGRIKFTKGAVTAELGLTGVLVDVSGVNYQRQTQQVTTSPAALTLGSIGTPGWVFIINRDSTNAVKVRSGSGGADVVQVKPGKFAIFELATATPYVVAAASTVEIEYLVIEE